MVTLVNVLRVLGVVVLGVLGGAAVVALVLFVVADRQAGGEEADRAGQLVRRRALLHVAAVLFEQGFSAAEWSGETFNSPQHHGVARDTLERLLVPVEPRSLERYDRGTFRALIDAAGWLLHREGLSRVEVEKLLGQPLASGHMVVVWDGFERATERVHGSR